LVQFAVLVEKELQGQQQRTRSNFGSSFTPKMTTTPPTKSFPPLSARPSAPLASTHFVAPSPTVTRTMDFGNIHVQDPAKSASSVASTGRSSSIQCHSCHGLGHMQQDCPSK
jgi:hypothetical protein